MKKEALIIILFLLIPLTYAEDDNWMFQTKELDMSLGISSSLEISPTSQDYILKYVTAELLFYPKTTEFQTIESISTTPAAQESEEGAIFTWDSPSARTLAYSLDANIRNENTLKQITKRVRFPLRNIPSEYQIYTEPTEHIDSDNAEIVRKASQLASGEDDLYVVLHNLGAWVKDNVDYSLNTMTADVSQPASWVLKSKYGVCDEITSLFIAMARSLGIPARYASGLAYTNYNNLNDWGAHAWAEVYFPGYGWVPYDITYGEFAFVDPTHITLRYSTDAGESSVEYHWLGNEVDIKTKKLDMKVNLLKKSGTISPLVKLKVSPVKSNIGFGSYNLLEADITNLNNYYVSTELTMSTSDGFTVLDNQLKQVYLEPLQEKKVYWIVMVNEDLNQNFIYTFPFTVSYKGGAASNSSFSSAYSDKIYSLTEVNELLKDLTEEEGPKRDLELVCNPAKEDYYEYDAIAIGCDLKNNAQDTFRNVNVCLSNDCKTITISASEEKYVEFSLANLEPGKKEYRVTAVNNEISTSDFVVFEINDPPLINIVSLGYPQSVNYDVDYEVSFMIDKLSRSVPLNLEINLYENKLHSSWNLSSLEADKPFAITLNSKTLGVKDNKFKLLINYQDSNQKSYSVQQEFFIDLKDVTLTERFKIYMFKLEFWLEGLFGKNQGGG